MLNMDNFANMLKINYEDPFFNQIVRHSELIDLFSLISAIKQGEQGRYIERANLFGVSESTGFRSENGNLPIPGGQVWIPSRIYLKKQLHAEQITRNAMANASKGKASFADWADVTLKQAAETVKSEADRALFGYGSGAICRIDGAPSGSSIPIDAPYGLPSNEKGYLPGIRRGKRLIAAANVDGTGVRNQGKSVQVLSVNRTANAFGGQLTIAGGVPADWVDNDFLFTGDDLGNNAPDGGVEVEPQGIMGMVDDGTILPTYLNINRTDYPEWQCQTLDANAAYGGTASELMFMRALTDTMENGDGNITHFITTFACFRNAYRDLVRADTNRPAHVQRTSTPGGGQVGGGNKLRFQAPVGNNLVEFRPLPKAMPGYAFGLDASTLKRYHLKKGAWEWVDWTGSMFHQVAVGQAAKDAVWFYGRNEFEFACESPQKNIRITGISETVA